MRLQIQPTGPVSVCLENAAGEPLIQNLTLDAGQDTEMFRSKRFRMSFGTGEAVMRVDGKAVPGLRRRPDRLRGARRRQAEGAARVRAPDLLGMSVRAGIVVTGTEVLSGIVTDRNGPWLSERLRERGVELAHIVVVADRPDDVRAALDFLAGEGVDVIFTSGGLGPTADDLTAEVVGAFAGRPMVLDPALEERILAILRRNRGRWRSYSEEAMRAGNRKQAMIPRRRDDPRAGRDRARPGRRRRPTAPGRSSSCCPARPASCARCGTRRSRRAPLRAVLDRAGTLEARMLRLYGVPESEIALSLLAIEDGGRAARPARDHDLPAAGGDRDRDRVPARRRAGVYDAFVGRRARAPRRHAVLRGRVDDRRAGRRRCSPGARSRSPSRAPAG